MLATVCLYSSKFVDQTTPTYPPPDQTVPAVTTVPLLEQTTALQQSRNLLLLALEQLR